MSLLTYSPSAGPDTNIYNLEDALLPDVRVSFNPAEVRGNIQRLNNGDWESTGVFVTPTTFNDKGEPTSFAQLTPDQIDVLQQPSPFPANSIPPTDPTVFPAIPQTNSDTGGNQIPDINSDPFVNPIPDDIPDNSVMNITGYDGLTSDEKFFVDFSLGNGQNVEIIPTSSERTPDFRIDGTLIELKTISGVADQTADGISGAIASRVMDGRGQATNIVVNAQQQSGITESIAERGIIRAFGADNITGSKIQSIRVIGSDFDITIPRR